MHKIRIQRIVITVKPQFMKKILFLTIIIGSFFVTQLQGQNQKKVNVNFGDTLNNVLSMGFQYLYPEFTKGTVHFSTNEKSTAFLNYNILLNEIQFMDLSDIRGKTFETESDFLKHAQSLDLREVSHITIKGDNFINTNRGIMYLVVNDETKLLRNDNIKMSGQSNIGAYGMQSQTSSVERRSSSPSERARRGEEFKQEIVTEYSRETQFYLLSDNRLRRATQRGFEKTFRSKRDDIRSYVDENDIDFKNENHLIKLLNYCVE